MQPGDFLLLSKEVEIPAGVVDNVSAVPNAVTSSLKNPNLISFYLYGAAEIPKTRIFLLANPQEITISRRKAIKEVYTREGWLTEHWGEDLPTISISGLTAAFFHSTEGITRVMAKDTLAYNNLQSILKIYRSNGINLAPAPKPPSTKKSSINNPLSPRSIALRRKAVGMTYNGRDFLGSFDSLNINQSEDHPYNMQYSIEFTVLHSGTFSSGSPEFYGHLYR